ncbi:MAG: Succinate--CoA ligase [ADP-forming] subunit beta [Chroococcidiopsis sp. SAG 2025]|uniref:succinate--CoA ligase subunit beta n=1 Tax=Chroococcidiopsis sp. SAG 2025 TaxID=171389 RepID=UPI0029373CF1|nr:succinate--CoA ligase subunit beta [Chroococcidiopsis sp. SAG 2025]MDV2995151.1 Succinate--CoA ligase [ADP-forming] subunit beta [Chroococcidiopsis sp. SAG 2025]
MDLLEYQAKEWFREIGIPVLPSQRIDRPRDLKGLKIPYPVVLKSQVRTGGRGKAGGVKIVTNTIDAIAAAQTIFNLPILGEFPEVLLAEAKYNSDREFYLAIVIDAVARRPLLLGSTQGGIDVESNPEALQQVVVERDFSPFYARRLAVKMGLQGDALASVSAIVEKMYGLFVQKDLDLIEINPLGVSSTGELMALDGKVTVNDQAIARHPDILMMAEKKASRPNGDPSVAQVGKWNEVDKSGNIAILGNGAGLLMATLDLIATASHRKPSVCLNVGHGRIGANGGLNFCDRVIQGLELIAQDKSIHAILVNILCSVPTTVEVAEAIATFVQQHENKTHKTRSHAQYPKLVVRLAGTDLADAKAKLDALQVSSMEDLDEAIAQVVRVAKSSLPRRSE